MIKKILKKIIPINVRNYYGIWIVSIEWFLLSNIFSLFPSQTLRIAFLRFKGAKIAKHAIVYGGCEFRNPKGLIIGNGSSIGHRSILDARMGLKIGKNVVLATEVMIWTLQHDYYDTNFKAVSERVTINDND